VAWVRDSSPRLVATEGLGSLRSRLTRDGADGSGSDAKRAAAHREALDGHGKRDGTHHYIYTSLWALAAFEQRGAPMKDSMRQVAAIASVVALLSACGRSTPSTPTPTIIAVTVTLTPRSESDPYHGNATFYDRGQTRQLIAVATLANGTSETVTTLATWRSSSPGVATVSNIGLVTSVAAVGVGAGATTITATYQGASGTLRVTVTVPDI
jgi:hypothetical protein